MRVIQTRAHEIATLRFSPDGGTITVLSRNRTPPPATRPLPWFDTAFRIDLSTGAELRHVRFGPARLAALSPRATYVAHVPLLPTGAGAGAVDVTSLGNGSLAFRIPLTAPQDVIYLADGQSLAVAVPGRGITRVKFGAATEEGWAKDESIKYPAEWLYLSPDGHYVVAGHDHLWVRVWALWQPPAHVQSRRTTAEPEDVRWRDLGDLKFSAERIAASADGRFAAVRKDGLHVGRFEGMEVERVLPHAESVCSAVAFSPDGRVLATADLDGRVGFWDPVTGDLTRAFEWGIGPLHSLAFAPDGLTCAAGGDEGRVVVWDVDG
jgi:WD40 repeat protein